MAELIKTQKVVGVGCAQYLSVIDIPFDVGVYEIIKIIKDVDIVDCYVVKNKVIINGELKKNIIFKTREGVNLSPNVDKICGDVMHHTVIIPFALFIEVPGAEEDDDCHVERAFVEGSREIERDFQEDGTFRELHEKTIIRVDVKVLRDVQICVETSNECTIPLPPGDCACCGGPGVQMNSVGPCSVEV